MMPCAYYPLPMLIISVGGFFPAWDGLPPMHVGWPVQLQRENDLSVLSSIMSQSPFLLSALLPCNSSYPGLFDSCVHVIRETVVICPQSLQRASWRDHRTVFLTSVFLRSLNIVLWFYYLQSYCCVEFAKKYFESGSLYVAQVVLDLWILMPQPSMH